MSGETRWRKTEVDETSQRQALTWDQRSRTRGSSLCSCGMRIEEFEKMAQSKPTGTILTIMPSLFRAVTNK